jgi:hypothetical protein
LCLRHSARIGGAGLPHQWCLFIKNERSCVLDALTRKFFCGVRKTVEAGRFSADNTAEQIACNCFSFSFGVLVC